MRRGHGSGEIPRAIGALTSWQVVGRALRLPLLHWQGPSRTGIKRLPYNTKTNVKICDLTQFYSPVSGGVKRYLHEKIAYIQDCMSKDKHVLVIPGKKTTVRANGRSRIYTIRAPLVSRTAQYRALLNLRAVDQILRNERPDIIESGDPYQLGWKAVRTGRALKIPVIGFYHSHFPEAYLRRSAKLFGKAATHRVMKLSRAYVRKLYNQCAATLVASERLAHVLRDWGVINRKVLLYVGRLAKEKNTTKLFRAFEILERRRPNDFHLLMIGDGAQRNQLRKLQARCKNLSSIRYCGEPKELARYYRAADLFVHPGVQETFGLVALESQACGTPVVGIRGSAMDDLIFHDQNDWALENKAEALAEAIERMSEKDLSSLGQKAAERAAQLHAWPRIFERLFCIYREVCANYKGNPAG
ncbi:MAG: glycosyltransferase family 1 protein [Verrucomicrobia bacterium]|nr:MAG: glycosyltransferase family 1 protein [Verrucomicrobiota bacterium]